MRSIRRVYIALFTLLAIALAMVAYAVHAEPSAEALWLLEQERSTPAQDAPPPSQPAGAVAEADPQPISYPAPAAGVAWITQKAAGQSPKRDLYVISDDPKHCVHCVTLERFLADAEVIEATRRFDCVILKHQRPQNAAWERWLDAKGVEGFPALIIFSPDRKCWVVQNGVFESSEAFVEWLEEAREVSRAVDPAPRIPKPQTAWPDYPIRGGRYWTGCRSWSHLTTGPHRGKFDSAWLRSLSWGELQSLHSDDHQGRVKWQFVVR